MATPRWKSYAFSLGFLAFIGTLNFSALPYLGYHASGFIFLVGALPIAVLHGLGPTLLFAVLSALTWDFFFIPPQFTFAIQTSEDVMMNITYLAVAIVSGFLGNRIRQQEDGLRERERHTKLLYELEKAFSPTSTVHEVLGTATAFIQSHLGVSSTALDGSTGDLHFPDGLLSSNEKEEANWTYRNERRAGAGTQTYPDSKHTYFPLPGNGGPAGVVVVEATQIRSATSESLLRKLCPTIGVAIERQRLRFLSDRNHLLEESEKLNQTLLNSVSHELRTPLTSILGNLDRMEKHPGVLEKSVLEELRLSARRLNQTVTNLLDMSRIASGVLQLKHDVIDLDDFLRSCISRSSTLLEKHRIVFRESTSPILIRGDEKLLETAVINLLANAVRHSPVHSEITIEVHGNGNSVQIEISDHGPGIPSGDEERVFLKFYTSGDSGGVGLGLAIVRAILEAHGGSARLVPNSVGGAHVLLTLPAEALPKLLNPELSAP